MLGLQYPFASQNLRRNGSDGHGRLLLRRLFHPLHTLQKLPPGPRKSCLRRLVLKALNQLFLTPYLLLLALIGLGLRRQVLLSLLPVRRIISMIPGEPPFLQLVDNLRRPVEKKPVMAHHHHCLAAGAQIFLQPLGCLKI